MADKSESKVSPSMTKASPSSTSNVKAKKSKSVAEKEDSSSESSESVHDEDEMEKVDKEKGMEEGDEEEKSYSQQIGKNVSQGPIAIDREEYLVAHRELSFDRMQAQMKNNILHRRLAEYYKKRKLEHVLKPIEDSQDLEDKYQQKLLSYEELKEKQEREMADIKTKVEAVQMTYEDRLEGAEKDFDQLQNHEKETGTGLIYSKKGKPIADKTVHRFLTLQRRKTEQESALCLRYIRARNAVADLEAIVRKLNRIGPGLYVVHFQQLDIDHQTLMTKIEEREDELIKNRGKCTEHSQMLAHIREKMNHTDEVIEFTECDLGDAEIEYQSARETLGSVKTRRDKLRWMMVEERAKAGLLTRKDLLHDYQDATDKVVMLRDRKEYLEKQINKTTMELRQARKSMLVSTENRESAEDPF